MTQILLLFLDGVGLGENVPEVNPFARAVMPNFSALLEGKALVSQTAPFHGQQSSLAALDACLGVQGLPQSATGQAALLTGINVPGQLGYHYGPKPNAEVARFLRNGSLFNTLRQVGKKVTFLNAYPPRYFAAVESGLRLYSAIPLAAVRAGLHLKTMTDLLVGHALSADFPGQGWRSRLGLPEVPVLGPHAAGEKLAALAQQHDFSFFEFWLTDYAGHKQDMAAAIALLQEFDQVLGGVLSAWDHAQGLIIITSDHGNLEDLGTRRHTLNPVPMLLVGAPEIRRSAERQYPYALVDLCDVARLIQAVVADKVHPADKVHLKGVDA